MCTFTACARGGRVWQAFLTTIALQNRIPIIVDEWSFLPPIGSPLHCVESDDDPQDPSGDDSEEEMPEMDW